MNSVSDLDRCVLSINAGSSSVKFSLHQQGDAGTLWRATVTGLQPEGHALLDLDGHNTSLPTEARSPGALVSLVGGALDSYLKQHHLELAATVHRVVHGGDVFTGPVFANPSVVEQLQTLCALAPLHQPANLNLVRAAQARWPGIPAIAVFDTAFHASLPNVETQLPLPRRLTARGLRRYGFHGLSYQWASEKLLAATNAGQGRVILAHLGNGSSICGTFEGRSQATSMGYSALDGLVMGSRSGSLDPGVLLHLMRQGLDADEIERVLYQESGLLGLSGVSADMRELRRSALENAQHALAVYEHRAIKEIAGIAALLGGVEALVFTGGIGENDPATRRALSTALQAHGLNLDEHLNGLPHQGSIRRIDGPTSKVEVWVVACDEGRVAADLAFELMKKTRDA